ncbi:MAG: hypothetical protein LBO77_01385 [Desulfovibrio sp.]|jgi:hypothetical protein|nr:hypothetical protein [Desulfovibrio sp.]
MKKTTDAEKQQQPAAREREKLSIPGGKMYEDCGMFFAIQWGRIFLALTCKSKGYKNPNDFAPPQAAF